MDIHIFWEGPFDLSSINLLNDENKDYGVYQVYGHHPLYGSSVLVYLGQANDQTFCKRIKQEDWLYGADPKNVEIYVGRLAGKKKIREDDWGERIDVAEKLLIFAHLPAFNTSNTKSVPERKVLKNRIYNWGDHRSLFPEISGDRCTSRFDHIEEHHIFTYPNIKE